MVSWAGVEVFLLVRAEARWKQVSWISLKLLLLFYCCWLFSKYSLAFKDINGDALPDACKKNSSGLFVALNTGTSFSTEVYWGDFDLVKRSDVSWDGGAYATASIRKE